MKKEDFLINLDNMSNHRVLLWEALQLTKGKLIEFGSGHGSTPFLKMFANESGREFESFDSNQDWANQTGAKFITDWDKVEVKNCSVLFLDHAPGERRKVDIVKHKYSAEIVVIHDTEPVGAGDYQVRQHFPKYKYIMEVRSKGAWATALSNTIDFKAAGLPEFIDL